MKRKRGAAVFLFGSSSTGWIDVYMSGRKTVRRGEESA